MRILSFGEILWDQIDGHEHLGGAPLNFSVASQRLGGKTFLVSGVGTDQRGCLALEQIRAHSLNTRFIQQIPGFPTGIATVVKNSTGNANFSIPRPAAFDRLSVTSEQIEALCQINPEWIYMGTLAQTTDSTFQLLQQCRKQLPETRCFYDINLRKGHWNLEIVQRLSALASVLKLNDEEAETLFQLSNLNGPFSIEAFCRYWSRTWDIPILCVTRGAKGCSIWDSKQFAEFPGYAVRVVDTVGAGDAYSAAFLHGLEQKWSVKKIAAFANAAGAIVASRSGATPDWTAEECVQMIRDNQ
jgi:fructokinase